MNSVWGKIIHFVNGSTGLGMLSPEQLIRRVQLAKKPLASFFVFNVLLFFAFRSHWSALLEFSQAERHYGHVVLIPLIVLYLLYRQGSGILAEVGWSPVTGAAVGLTGGAFYALARSLEAGLSRNDYLALATLGLVAVWIGGFVAFLSVGAARAALFPLSLLVFVIPIPDRLLQQTVTTLQWGTVHVTAFVFGLLPIPVYQEGTLFLLPDLAIDVTPACSGIRSSLALLVTSLLAGHLFLHSSWGRTGLAAVAIPIAIFKNGLRIVTLCLLSIYVDRGFLDGPLHTQGGYPFFILALLLLLPFLWLLQRWEKRSSGDVAEPQP